MNKDIDKEIKDLDMDHAEAEEVLEDVAYYRTLVANIIMIGKPYTEDWVLVDTSVERYAKRIYAACEKRFSKVPPSAIILTHGHFDHVGSALELAKFWDIPIYIHQDEIDYVTDKKTYPPADPTVGGGALSLLSPIFPKKPVNLKGYVEPLPPNGNIPFLNDWQYIHTPGHSPGHIVLYREHDKILITGDAVVTENPESSFAMLFPFQKVHGPPAYFTSDWQKAEQSVKKLAELEPEHLIAGHGLPMEGELLREQLQDLANDFIKQAIPKHKRQ